MLVLIDLDNTLSDRAAVVESWAKEFAQDWSLPNDAVASILETDNDGYSSRREVLASVCERFAIDAPVEQVLAAYQSRVVELSVPTPGALDCLEAMRDRGWKTVILSNGSSGQQHGKIDALGLRSLVDGVCISGDLDVKKPTAKIFHAAAALVGAELSGGQLRDSWMVGDSPLHDIIGAERLGMKTAWLDRGRSWSEPSVTPTVTIASLEQLVAAIDLHE
ncbi:MAG: HAD family hydrolase [Acidimicrobiales bacterium]